MCHTDNWGAHTVVFNQTTVHNGNIDAPVIPSEGWFVYRAQQALHSQWRPHRCTAPACSCSPKRQVRRTVTSWETLQPLEPNCHFVPDNELPRGIKSHMGSVDWENFGSLSNKIGSSAYSCRFFAGEISGAVERKIQTLSREWAGL